jgi:hypothetical protein
MAAELRGDMPQARMAFERVEKFLAGLAPAERAAPSFVAARATLAADADARNAYLALVRATSDPALRVRMAAVAHDVGWLDARGHRAELARTIHDVVAADALDFGEVDLICALNKDDALAHELALFRVATVAPARRACSGAAPAWAMRPRAIGRCARSKAPTRATCARPGAPSAPADPRREELRRGRRGHRGDEDLRRAGARHRDARAPARRRRRGAGAARGALFARPLASRCSAPSPRCSCARTWDRSMRARWARGCARPHPRRRD